MKPGETNNTRPEHLKNRMLRCAKSLLGVGLGTLLFLTAIVGQAAGQKTPEVQKAPSPQALFVRFGESSIDFELRAWTDTFIDWRQISSELAVTVYDAVLAAGMCFPFPQRVVRLLHDSEE